MSVRVRVCVMTEVADPLVLTVSPPIRGSSCGRLWCCSWRVVCCIVFFLLCVCVCDLFLFLQGASRDGRHPRD